VGIVRTTERFYPQPRASGVLTRSHTEGLGAPRLTDGILVLDGFVLRDVSAQLA
jgi:hypothetical protein